MGNMGKNYFDKRDTDDGGISCQIYKAVATDTETITHTHTPGRQLCRLQLAEPGHTTSFQSGEHARRNL